MWIFKKICVWVIVSLVTLWSYSDIYANSNISSYQWKLDQFLLKVVDLWKTINNDKKFEIILTDLESKLASFSSKYSKNVTILEMIQYLQTWIKEIKNSLSNENEINDFLCNLMENCDNNSSSSTTPTQNQNNNTGSINLSLDSVCDQSQWLVPYACWKPYKLNIKSDDLNQSNGTYFVKEDEVITFNWSSEKRLNQNPIEYKIYIDGILVYSWNDTSWTWTPKSLWLTTGWWVTPLYLQDENGIVYNLNGLNIQKQYVVRMVACQFDEKTKEEACTVMAPDDRTRDSFMIYVWSRPSPTKWQEKIFDSYIQNNNYEKAAKYALWLWYSPSDIAEYVNQRYWTNITAQDVKKYAWLPTSDVKQPSQQQLNTFDSYIQSGNYTLAAKYALWLWYSTQEIAEYVNQTYGTNISPQDVQKYSTSWTTNNTQPTQTQVQNFDNQIQSWNYSQAASYALQQWYTPEQIAEYVNQTYGTNISPQDVMNYSNQK